MEPLSVLIPTLNEADNLPECLESCSFADEIVVVDSGSDDGTAELARERGARVLVHPFEGHARQKNWGLERVTHRWVLLLDADERVTPALRDEIRALLARPDRRGGYWIRRRTTFLGREIRGAGWQRDKVLRFFDREAGRYEDKNVHEEVRIRGRVGRLRHPLVHHSCRDLASWIAKTERYAELGAEDAWARGRRARRTDLVLRPLARFLKQYVVQGGVRDGLEGGILCVVSSFGVFLKYAKLHQLERERGRAERPS